ncbi:MAG: DUF4388 domain-containing protein [Acidobacteriota bacterium]
MAFQGSLKELPLPDIIQLVSVSGKTGVFVLQSPGQTGEIYLDAGEIVHAAVGKVEGENAVYELAIWQDGEFVFRPGTETDRRTIKKSNTNLLMEAARRIDEWQVLSKRVPSTRMVPTFTSHNTSTSVSFTPQEWHVISKIDERRSIDDLASVLGVSAFEVCKVLYGLVTAGLVELREGLGQLQAERLQQMTPNDLAQFARWLEDQSKTLLAGQPPRRDDLEAVAQRARGEMESGRGYDAVLDMVRSVEQIMSAALGPNQSRVFLESVNKQLSG